MTSAELLALVIAIALTAYALGGGADFGGGVWDAFAFGPSAARQRALIAHAIGPIWEANHVWLVLVIVLLFVGFPLAFAALATALHVPLTIALIGIVLRGAAFTFRTYDRPDRRVQRRWSRVFAIASIVTPVAFGACVGATLSGRIRVDPATGTLPSDFVTSWLAPFPIALGLMVLALFAFLAATYLTVETSDRELQEAFRARALAATLVAGALAWICAGLARTGAPRLHATLFGRGAWVAFAGVGVPAAIAIAALLVRRYAIARAAAIAQVAMVICGWTLQRPVLIAPDLTVANAAAPPHVIRAVLWALAAGGVLLIPAQLWLFRLFKSRPAEP